MIDLAREVGYNVVAKKHFEQDSRRFLKTLARKLNLLTYDITYNKGGIAVSGETVLIGAYDNGKHVYVTMSTPSSNGIMFRKISHAKDYQGGVNQWIHPVNFSKYEEIAEYIKRRTYV